MKWEQDFRNMDQKFEQSAVTEADERDRKQMDTMIADCIEQVKLYQSQFIRRRSDQKLHKVLETYYNLRTVAEINSGYISLEIDGEREEAVLTYWGDYLFITNANEEGEDITVPTFISLLSSFKIVTFSAKENEVVMEARENLYEEVRIADKSSEIAEIRNRRKRRIHSDGKET